LKEVPSEANFEGKWRKEPKGFEDLIFNENKRG